MGRAPANLTEIMPQLTRREWAQLISVLGAMAGSARAQSAGRGASLPQVLDRSMLKSALETIGLKFTDPQLDMMLPGVNRFLASYQVLRGVEVPLDTPPAIAFSPVLPGHPAPKGPSIFKVPRDHQSSHSRSPKTSPSPPRFNSALSSAQRRFRPSN